MRRPNPAARWRPSRGLLAAPLLGLAAMAGAQEAATEPSAAPLAGIPVQATPADEAAVQLESVVVRAGRVAGPAEPFSSGLDGASHTQPLSIVSYSIDELMAFGARDQREALETVASVIAPVSFQLQPQGAYSLRGFDAYLLRDGFASFGSYGDRDSLAGIERIDFVKGPGSSLNSGALGLPPGGAIDIHSRWAGTRRQLSLAAGGSRYQQRNYLVDLDSGDLLPVLSLALAAERGEGGGFFDWAVLDHQKLRPSLSLRGFGGRLSFYYEDSRRTQKDYPGLPTTGTLDTSGFSIPDSRSVMDPDVPLSHTRTRAQGVDGLLPITGWLELSAAARQVESHIDQAAQYVSSNAPDYAPLLPSTFQRLSGTYDGETIEKQARARLTARSPDWTLAGIELGRWTGWLSYGGEDGPDHIELYTGLAAPIDLAEPRYTRWAEPILPFAQSDSRFHIRNLSAGLQWRYGAWLNAFYGGTRTQATVDFRQSSVTDQLIRDLLGEQALAALQPLLDPLLQNPLLQGTGLFVDRRDHYDLAARQYGVAAKLWKAYSDQDEDGLWLFYGRGEGHQFRAYFTGSESPKPELSEQREFGLRLVNSDWGRLEAAHFDIRRRNVPTLNPNDPTGLSQISTGLQSVRGYDLEASLNAPYRFWDRFTLNASAAWLRSRLDEDNSYPVGNRLPGVPARRWRGQLVAELLRVPASLRVFGTYRCQSASEGDLGNNFTVPGRCLSDAGATLGWRDFSIDLAVNNLTDVRYYEPYTYLFNGVIPGEARNLRLILAYRFRH